MREYRSGGARSADSVLSRRNFLNVAAMSAAGATLAACGGGSPEIDQRKITFWSSHPADSQNVELELISRFEAAHPHLTVNLVTAGKNYEEVAQQFSAALSGGDLPDVVLLSDVWWFHFALSGAITPLDQYFAEVGVNLDDYVDSLRSDYLFNGQHYALPYARSTPLFYYNRNLWGKAGLPDRGPHTWDEFAQWGPELQRAIGGKYAHGWGNATDYLGWTFEGPTWTFGAGYSDGWRLTMTDDATVEAGEFLQSMIHKKRYGVVVNELATDFASGILASTIASTGDLSAIAASAAFDFGTAFLPSSSTGEPGCPTGGAGVAIPWEIPDQRKVDALTFIDFVTNGANTAYYSQNLGYLPVRKSSAQDLGLQTFLGANPNFRTAVDQLAYSRSQDYARVFVPGGDQIIGHGLERVALWKADVPSTFAGVQAQLQAIIDTQIAPRLPQ